MNAAPQLGPLIVVSGPSGVGKTTVVERLIEKSGLPLRRAITATTRDKRGGETDCDYHFWTVERFEKEIADKQMLEHAKVFGKDFYGTPKSEVDPFRERGTGVILVIDVQGAARIRDELKLDHLSVFIDPPSIEELEERLRGRKDTSEERIQQRLKTAREEELPEAPKFQHRIVNRDLAQAVRELERIIRDHFYSATNQGETKPCSTS